MMVGAMLRVVVMAGFMGLVASCGAAVPPVPRDGGPAWIELTSEHFTVWTDASSERARELIREMERFWQIVVGTTFPSIAASGRNFVIVLRDDDELTAFSLTGEPRAYAMSASAPLFQPMFVLSAFSNRDLTDRTVAHELTHAISFGVIHHQPRWLAEGMAMFFETVEIDPNSTTADIGVEPLYRGQRPRMAHLVPISKLFAWGRPAPDEGREYSTAWALFTYLINKHQAELVNYMQLVDRSYDPEATREDRALRAWNEAFPSLPLDSADNVLQQWLLTGNHLVAHINVHVRAPSVAQRTLGDADVYAIRALLRAHKDPQTAQVHADVAAALSAEPANVLAWLVRDAFEHESPTVEEARAMVAVHGDDWRAWFLEVLAITEHHGDAAELETARIRACELHAQNPALSRPAMCKPRATTPPR